MSCSVELAHTTTAPEWRFEGLIPTNNIVPCTLVMIKLFLGYTSVDILAVCVFDVLTISSGVGCRENTRGGFPTLLCAVL
jgi:hypothetical protein